MSLSKILYRDLVHVAKQFDRHASLRALLSSNMLQRPVIHDSNTRLPHIERYNRFLLEYLGNKSFYVPSVEKKALVELIREKYRAAGSGAADRVHVDTAFVALKALNDTLAEAKELGVIGSKTSKKATAAGSQAAAAAGEQSASIGNVQLAE